MSVLWLLRHGEAARPAGVDDFERPLTPRGIEQAKEAGRTLAEQAGELAVVLTSPRVRARDTARLASAAHGDFDEPVIIDELGDDYTTPELLALISPWTGRDGEPPADAAVLVVSHNPALPQVAAELIGEAISMPTGTLVAIELSERRLLHHIEPES